MQKKKKIQKGGKNVFTQLYIYIYIYLFNIYIISDMSCKKCSMLPIQTIYTGKSRNYAKENINP